MEASFTLHSEIEEEEEEEEEEKEEEVGTERRLLILTSQGRKGKEEKCKEGREKRFERWGGI